MKKTVEDEKTHVLLTIKRDDFKIWSCTFLPEAQTVTITKEQIDVVNWQKVGGAWVLRLFTTEGKVYRFAGFQDWDRLQLSRSVHYNNCFLFALFTVGTVL